MLLVENQDFSALIDCKPFSSACKKQTRSAWKSNQKKKKRKSENDDYKTGNLLDYLYHWKHNKLIDIELLRQTSRIIPQKINVTLTLHQCLLSLKSSQKLL